MSDPIATVDDLATYLNVTDINTDRAALLLQLAHNACESIVSPVPDTARGVELDVAGRAYANPTAIQSSAPGPYGTPLGSLPGGLFLTNRNMAELRRLAVDGGSGAFTIDPTPTDAGPSNYWTQIPLDPSQPWENPPFYGDFDQVPT